MNTNTEHVGTLAAELSAISPASDMSITATGTDAGSRIIDEDAVIDGESFDTLDGSNQ